MTRRDPPGRLAWGLVAPSNASPAPPLLAERYRLERRLAQGGMAEVWLATDTLLNRSVAVKVLKPALAADPVVAERFRREAVAVAGLNHPNIVAIYDTVDERGRQAVVMQYVPGKSLRQLLDEDNTLSPEMTIRIGEAVAAALDNAHRAGLVHRDVKPGNILVTPEGRVLLTDFGIAKALEGETDLTSDNIMMGTAKYLSPEQVRGRRLDGRADLYSLGLVLYECLVGRVPFLGDNDAATALARLQRDPTPINRLRPTLPAGLAELIHRLLARNPDERPANGAVVHSQLSRIRVALDDLTGGTPGLGRPTPPPTPPPTPSRGTPVTRAAGAATTGSVGATRPSRPTPRPGAHPPETTPSANLRVAPRPRPPVPSVNRSPKVIVGVLVMVAIVVTIGLLSSIGRDDDDTASAGSTTPTDAPVIASTATTLPSTGEPGISRGFSYDPLGEDLAEHEDLVPNALDGSEGTSWQTVCYANEYMGSKSKVGVGLVLELTAATAGELELTFGALPWAIEVYGADDLPESFAGWGAALDDRFSTEKLNATLSLGGTPHKYVLVLLKQLAKDPGCGPSNPYLGRISEISLVPAG